ncbi:MAG: aldose epimerase family protein [Pseudomonadota bacterium]
MPNATHRLATAAGFTVDTVSTGAAISRVTLPVAGRSADVALRYTNPILHLTDRQFIGSTIGRYANRLANGTVVIGSHNYSLAMSAGDLHCLHGGPVGFGRRVWKQDAASSNAVSYRLRSVDGDQGFPGTVDVTAQYRVSEPATLEIDYLATTDAETVISLTNHSYINLHGNRAMIDGHQLSVNADSYLPVNEALIPTGDYGDVTNSRYDYRARKAICGGDALDTCFIINGPQQSLRYAAQLVSPASGITLTLYTSLPALQVYTGDYLRYPFCARAGLCLEPQQLPDAPNQPLFPPATLKPGEPYHQKTRYVFTEANA